MLVSGFPALLIDVGLADQEGMHHFVAQSTTWNHLRGGHRAGARPAAFLTVDRNVPGGVAGGPVSIWMDGRVQLLGMFVARLNLDAAGLVLSVDAMLQVLQRCSEQERVSPVSDGVGAFPERRLDPVVTTTDQRMHAADA